MTVDELVKAYRKLRAENRQRGRGRMNGSYANAGIETMAINRSAAASHRYVHALTGLQQQIQALPGGQELLGALETEARTRDEIKSLRHDTSWKDKDREPELSAALQYWSRSVRDLASRARWETAKGQQTETQQVIQEALETVAERAKNVFVEPVMCQPLYLGPGVHEDGQATWNVHDYEESSYVGTIHVVWPDGPGGRVEYEGTLFSDIGPTFRVTDLVIATVLLHLGVELGRRRKRKVTGA